MRRCVILICFTIVSLLTAAQSDDCAARVLEYERAMAHRNDSCPAGKTVVYGYKIRSMTQEDEVSESKVKVYFDGRNMNLFSEQANVYRNDREALMILPTQKLLVINSTTPDMNSLSAGDQMLVLREEFLKHCRTVECVTLFGKHRRLVLEAEQGRVSAIQIHRLTYEYDEERQIIISVKTDYNEHYKLKQLVVTYSATEWVDDYRFAEPISVFSDKKGRILEKYSDYEVIDNRDGNDPKKRH